MTAAAGARSGHPGRFRLLATALAGRPLGVEDAPGGDGPYTDGVNVFVSPGVAADDQRRQVVLQAALLGAGSLDAPVARALRGRPKVARRYLAVEGRRVLADLAPRLPSLALALAVDGPVVSTGVEESLALASGRARLPEPPAWFGRIRPGRLLGTAAAGPGSPPTPSDLRAALALTPEAEAGEDDDESGEESKLLKLFQNPLAKSNALSEFLGRLLGMSRTPAPGPGASGGDLATAAARRVGAVGPDARPLPVPLSLTGDEAPGPAGVGGALYPEWDVHKARYRPEWCRVLEIPLGPAADVAAGAVERDQVLHRRLARLGLGPKVLRRRPDGDDLDVDALIDLAVDLRAGHSPAEHVYLERRKLARNLGVLVLLDASGSATDLDPAGRSVHEHQRRAAVTLAATLEELGDRVAVYGFRSRGRSAVEMLAVKPFGHRFGAGGRAHLHRLAPAGYTRLGAAVRHAGEVLKAQAGTPNRLLVVLSDGFPFDDGYESRYAEADARKALEEVRGDGVACLCLSIGAPTPTESLDRVFGSASHASAPVLSDLSPRMDELFLGALKELAVPNPAARRNAVRFPSAGW
ncbi:MAG TPA: VWA domain-containing protein [Acidimicrobiia bacterium]|nr:VWA domain-containing protein [Acidimicrobiia bacterium]